MSGAPDAGLDLHAELARIDRDREETRKFVAEQHKLLNEAYKMNAERIKLGAEAEKITREGAWFPWLQLLTLAASSAVIGAIVARLIH